jgi:nucleotide-binding universal stress UspA family protein
MSSAQHLQPIRRILVATSLGEMSDAVMRAALELSRATGAELWACHAYPLPLSYFAIPSGFVDTDPQLLDTARERFELLLGEQLFRLGAEENVLAGSVIEAGAPHRILHQAAERLRPDVMVMGAAEKPSALRPLLGSTTDRVLRWVRCPVFVVRGALTLPPVKVLTAVDLSELAAQMVENGLELLGRLGGAEPQVTALFVLSDEERDRGGQFTREQIERFASEELARFLAPFDGRLSSRLRVGEPRQEILKEIAVASPDLVLLGTHGRSGFERWLLGSVASDIVASSSASLLVVPPRAAAEG